MIKSLRVLPFVFLAVATQAQVTYTHTLPNIEGSQLNSWVEFSFPNATGNIANGTLSFGWLACWQQVFGGSSKIWIEIETGPDVWTQVYYETGNVTECVTFNRTANVGTTNLTNAITVGTGSVIGRVRVQDSCYPGVGCSFYNDPVVSGLTLEYQAHAANFTVSDASICPGASVQFTDASLGTPSSYAWYFEGGVPTTSTDPDPLVQYPNPGTWDVVLSVVTANGPDELLLSNHITVNNLPAVNAGVDADVCAGETQQLQASGGTSYQWSPTTGLSNAALPNPVAIISETTTYTVSVLDANGCTGSDTIVLTYHELPVVSASAGDNTLCSGDTADISAVGASVYAWSPNLFISSNVGANVQVWPPSDFTWTLFGTDVFGCSHDTTLTIDVLPAPPAPVATNTGMTVESSLAVGYQWYLDGVAIPGATDQTWSPLVNGYYSVMITDTDGCESESAPIYFGTVVLDEQAAEVLWVYPQPATDEFFITNVKAGSQLLLIDAAGREVLSQRSSASGSVRLDVKGLVPGNYLLEERNARSIRRLTVLIQ